MNWLLNGTVNLLKSCGLHYASVPFCNWHNCNINVINISHASYKRFVENLAFRLTVVSGQRHNYFLILCITVTVTILYSSPYQIYTGYKILTETEISIIQNWYCFRDGVVKHLHPYTNLLTIKNIQFSKFLSDFTFFRQVSCILKSIISLFTGYG